MAAEFPTFKDFYPYYLSEHRHPVCRRLHFAGSTFALCFLGLAVFTLNPWWLLAALAVGYAFAWVGHFGFEKNRPATFKHPFYSFMGDWVMWKDILTGRIKF